MKRVLGVSVLEVSLVIVLLTCTTTGHPAADYMTYDEGLVAAAMRQTLAPFTLRLIRDEGEYSNINTTLPDSPQWAVLDYWDTPAVEAGEAFRYLASVNAAAPLFEVDGKTVEDRVLEIIRYYIAGTDNWELDDTLVGNALMEQGSNEWGTSGNGLSALGYVSHALGMAIVKVQSPNTWARLTAAEQAKADLLMEATLIGAHYASADANYLTEDGGIGEAPTIWWRASFQASTGVDQTGNYHRGWNLNHRVGVLTAISAYYYFGGANGGSEYCNAVLANFDYESFRARLREAGFKNIYNVYGNAGNETDPGKPAYAVGLQLRTRSSSGSNAGEYLYFGNSMDEIGKWLLLFIEGGLSGGPVRPYGGDTQRHTLTPMVADFPPLAANSSIVRPYGYAGFLWDNDDFLRYFPDAAPERDILLDFPNLGAPGMQMEFDTGDAGDRNLPDREADGARSSVAYVMEGEPYVMNAFFMLRVFEGLSKDGKTVGGIPIDHYADILVQMVTGIEDYRYKADIGYQAFSRGRSRPDESRSHDNLTLWLDDIWNNATDNPRDKLGAINAARTVAGLRPLLEDPMLGLILFQYNGLGEEGKNAVTDAVLKARGSFKLKKEIQEVISAAVAVEAVKEFNGLLARGNATAESVLAKLHVDLRRAGLAEDYVQQPGELQGGVYFTSSREYTNYNALGIFVYGFTDFNAYKQANPGGIAARLAVSQYLIDNAPSAGYADRKAIRDAIKAGLKSIN